MLIVYTLDIVLSDHLGEGEINGDIRFSHPPKA